MKLFIDTEFNGFGGQLISLAVVSEDDQEWYETFDCKSPDPWVLKNVIPVLNKPPVAREWAQVTFQRFLNQWKAVTVYADWPEDISHFCMFLLVAPGQIMLTPKLEFKLMRVSSKSQVPHNALSDARGIREAILRNL